VKMHEDPCLRETHYIPLGTCFPFRQSTHYLTAAHCLKGAQPEEISVLGMFIRDLQPARQIIRHPTADLALVVFDQIGTPHGDLITPFRDFDRHASIGSDFIAFGYPQSYLGVHPETPTIRLHKGHIQRFIDFESVFGYSYWAAELSIFPLKGLSGGPIYRSNVSGVVFGVVAESMSTAVASEKIEEVQDDTGTYRTINRELISYGVGVMLDRHEAWLNEHVPRLDPS
jgi:hypothetical protein